MCRRHSVADRLTSRCPNAQRLDQGKNLQTEEDETLRCMGAENSTSAQRADVAAQDLFVSSGALVATTPVASRS